MKKIVLLVLVFLYSFAVDATMEIIKDAGSLPKIFIKDSSQKKYKIASKNLISLISKDLRISGHFDVKNSIKHNKLFEKTALKALGYGLFLDVELFRNSNHEIEAKAVLRDLNSDEDILVKNYSVSSLKQYPFLAHFIAIDINKKIDAPTIEWMKRYVVFAKYTSSRKSEIVIADYTLSYQQTVIKGGLNIFPKWANKEQSKIYYTSLLGDKPTLFMVDIFTGKKDIIYKSSGMLVCSDVDFDNNKILMTAAPSDQPDIYLLDLASKEAKRVTFYSGIDVNAQFVKDNKVVFVSNRFGSPNIFLKSIDGSNVEKLVDYGKDNSSSTTFRNYVVFSSKEGYKLFNLYLISTDTTSVRKLTAQGVNQFPKFSLDGESILYLKQLKNHSYLGIIRLNQNGTFLFPLKTNTIQSIDW